MGPRIFSAEQLTFTVMEPNISTCFNGAADRLRGATHYIRIFPSSP